MSKRFRVVIDVRTDGLGGDAHQLSPHVIPALMKERVDALDSGADRIDVWGTGLPNGRPGQR